MNDERLINMSGVLAEFKLEQYDLIQTLDEKGSVELVRNKETNTFCVKKMHEVYNIEVYKSLVQNPHPNIAIYYEYFVYQDKLVTIEELVNGYTLHDYIKQKGLPEVNLVRAILLQLCDALNHLHSLKDPIIHRDIKLTNIMIDSSNNIKLIDFNISRIYNDSQNKDTLILGTAGFAAPEQFGFQQTDVRTDIYAIGILINFLLVGEVPQIQLHNGVFLSIIRKCTQLDPKSRYQNISHLRYDISKIKENSKNRTIFQKIIYVFLFGYLILTILSFLFFIILYFIL